MNLKRNIQEVDAPVFPQRKRKSPGNQGKGNDAAANAGVPIASDGPGVSGLLSAGARDAGGSGAPGCGVFVCKWCRPPKSFFLVQPYLAHSAKCQPRSEDAAAANAAVAAAEAPAEAPADFQGPPCGICGFSGYGDVASECRAKHAAQGETPAMLQCPGCRVGRIDDVDGSGSFSVFKVWRNSRKFVARVDCNGESRRVYFPESDGQESSIPSWTHGVRATGQGTTSHLCVRCLAMQRERNKTRRAGEAQQKQLFRPPLKECLPGQCGDFRMQICGLYERRNDYIRQHGPLTKEKMTDWLKGAVTLTNLSADALRTIFGKMDKELKRRARAIKEKQQS
jgi:hypothetical protein